MHYQMFSDMKCLASYYFNLTLMRDKVEKNCNEIEKS